MIAYIKALFGSDPIDDVDSDQDQIGAAAAALLVEAALIDGDFDDAERQMITSLLQEQFALSDDEVRAVIAAAEDAVDHTNTVFASARHIRNAFDDAQQIALMEMLWRVVYADGVLHEFESNLVRRIAGLLYVRDQDSGLARKRALKALGLDENQS